MRHEINIGIYRDAGIGDTVQLTAFCKAVKMKFTPCVITAYVRKHCVQVLEDNPNIDNPQAVSGNWLKEVEDLRKRYEIFIDCRYVTKIYFNNPAFAIETPKIEGFDYLFDKFTSSNRFILDYGINTFYLPFISTNLRGTPDDMWIKTTKPEGFPDNGKYVVLHTDSSNAPTKSWFSDYWNEVGEYLKSKGMKVVLVGTIGEHKIACDFDFRCKTNIFETAYIIKHAGLFVGVDTGLAHIARAVRTKSVVLFGPTSPVLFGYPENINIQVGDCRNCFGRSGFWFWSCPENGYSLCMRQLTPELVKSTLQAVLFEKPEIPAGESGEGLLEKK